METTTARQAILDRIRARQRRDARLKPTEHRAAEADIANHLRGPQPALGGDMVLRFAQQVQALQTTLEHVADWAAAPAAVAAYLRTGALPLAAAVWPELGHLPWAEAGLAVQLRRAHDADAVGITGCFCAVAETGSLVLASGPQTPASVHLLPETHVALVPRSRILPTLEDAFALLRAEHGGVPRALNIVSGPSRTGDIEQTIVLGAHGPYRVHVVIVDAA